MSVRSWHIPTTTQIQETPTALMSHYNITTTIFATTDFGQEEINAFLSL